MVSFEKHICIMTVAAVKCHLYLLGFFFVGMMFKVQFLKFLASLLQVKFFVQCYSLKLLFYLYC